MEFKALRLNMVVLWVFLGGAVLIIQTPHMGGLRTKHVGCKALKIRPVTLTVCTYQGV